MKNHATKAGAALAIVFTLYGASALAQNTPNAVDTHLIAARTAAGFDARSGYVVRRTGQSLR